jgi:predicted membrane protein
LPVPDLEAVRHRVVVLLVWLVVLAVVAGVGYLMWSMAHRHAYRPRLVGVSQAVLRTANGSL